MDELIEIKHEIEKIRLRLIKHNKENNRYENAATNDHLLSSIWWIERLMTKL